MELTQKKAYICPVGDLRLYKTDTDICLHEFMAHWLLSSGHSQMN